MGKQDFEERPALARNIISRREAKGWSQSDLAHKAGVHVNIVKKLETGGGEGSPATREALAGALGCAIADLFHEANGLPKNADLLEAAGFLSKFADAPPHIQRLVLAILYMDGKRLAGTPREVQDLATKLLKAVVSL